MLINTIQQDFINYNAQEERPKYRLVGYISSDQFKKIEGLCGKYKIKQSDVLRIIFSSPFAEDIVHSFFILKTKKLGLTEAQVNDRNFKRDV